MLLAIDCGNTQTVIGLFNELELVDHWRIATAADRTSDELALMFQQFLGFHGFSFDAHVTGVAIASGVPRVTAALREMTERYFGFEALVLEPGVRTGMSILYDEPKNVGADRIANAVGAYDLYGGPTIIVDFGTANTVDAVSAKGEYLGGAIFPGIEISLDALFARAAALRQRGAGRAEERHREVDDRGHPVGRGLRLQRPGRRHRRPLRSRARNVDGRRHGGTGGADHAALPDHPALRALADPPGTPHRPRAEQLRWRTRSTSPSSWRGSPRRTSPRGGPTRRRSSPSTPTS